MKLTAIANETLEIIKAGHYVAPSGKTVDIGAAALRAKEGTVLFQPGELDDVRSNSSELKLPSVEITGETTGAAAKRLFLDEQARHVVALNFASAKNPGGGFLRGAKAQEEDLARCSALYTCQLTQPAYYQENRACKSPIYTDYLIYSPDVPFFRSENLELLEEPFLVSIITSPAPNAGEVLKSNPKMGPAILKALEQRTAMVLAAAARFNHRTLILGAWGCGVFRNDPEDVAHIFANWLQHPRFLGLFDRIVFAVYDRSPGQYNRKAFESRFAGFKAP